MDAIDEKIGQDPPEESLRKIVEWIGDFDRLVEEASLVQARARLESIILEPVKLDPTRRAECRAGQPTRRHEQPCRRWSTRGD